MSCAFSALAVTAIFPMAPLRSAIGYYELRFQREVEDFFRLWRRFALP